MNRSPRLATHAAEAVRAAVGCLTAERRWSLPSRDVLHAGVVRLGAWGEDASAVLKGLVKRGVEVGGRGAAGEHDDERRSTYGMPDARGEKRTKPKTVHIGPKLTQAIEHLASHERRTFSAYVEQVLERDPVVKTVLQQIGGPPQN